MAKKLGPCLYPLEGSELDDYKARLLEQEMDDDVKVKLEDRKPKIEKREPKEEMLY